MSDENAAAGDAAQESEAGAAGTHDFPEADFLRHCAEIAMQVSMAMGDTENPLTGSREKNLPAARFLIDTLVMLQEKTKGNLTDDEDTYLSGVITNLKMAWVSRTS